MVEANEKESANTMRRQDVIDLLNRHRDELSREFGITSLALFGSTARDEAAPGSDVDLLATFDDRPVGILHLLKAERHLSKLLGAKVDLVLRRTLRSELKAPVLGEALDVFATERMEVPPAPHVGRD